LQRLLVANRALRLERELEALDISISGDVAHAVIALARTAE
jgi:hypothetical protein